MSAGTARSGCKIVCRPSASETVVARAGQQTVSRPIVMAVCMIGCMTIGAADGLAQAPGAVPGAPPPPQYSVVETPSAEQFSAGPQLDQDLFAPGAAVTRPSLLFIPRIEARQAFTDNARGAPPGQQRADTYSTISPGFVVDYWNAHNRFIADYSFDKFFYFHEDDLNALNHHYSHSSQSELIDGLLFFDSSAAISDVTLNSRGNVSADPTVVFPDNSTTMAFVNGSPYARYGIGGYASMESRYRFQNSTSLSGGAQDSRSHQFTQTVASGYEFDRFLWALTLDGGFTDYSGQAAVGPSTDRTTTSRLAIYGMEVPIVREFSIIGSGGYERIDDATLRDEPNGPIWSIGFRLRPGPRTSLRLEYVDRYNRANLSGGFVYLISPRSRFEITYSQSLNSTQGTATTNLAYLAPDGFGNLVDVRSGKALSLSDSIFGFSSAAFLSERLESRLVLAGENHTSTISAFRETRTGSVSQSDQEALGVAYTYARSLSDRLNFTFFTSFAISKTGATGIGPAGTIGTGGTPLNAVNAGANNEDEIIRAGGSLVYAISESLTGTANYSFARRDSNAAGGDLQENLIVLGLRKAF